MSTRPMKRSSRTDGPPSPCPSQPSSPRARGPPRSTHGGPRMLVLLRLPREGPGARGQRVGLPRDERGALGGTTALPGRAQTPWDDPLSPGPISQPVYGGSSCFPGGRGRGGGHLDPRWQPPHLSPLFGGPSARAPEGSRGALEAGHSDCHLTPPPLLLPSSDPTPVLEAPPGELQQPSPFSPGGPPGPGLGLCGSGEQGRALPAWV